MAARMAVLAVLLHDPTTEVSTGDRPTTGEPDTDRTVGLRLIGRRGKRQRRAAAPARPQAEWRNMNGPPVEEGDGPGIDGTGIDPRIRARRIAVRRSQGRRRLRLLLAAAVVLVVLLLALGATRTPLLDVDRVAVVGAARTPLEDVLGAAAIPSGQALLDVDLGAIERQVDDLPWVAAAEASRHWPGTVVVRIEERQPVAIAAVEDGGWAVLSADGRLMQVVDEPPAGLVPLMDVPPVEDADAVLAPATLAALEVVRLLPESMLARVTAVAPVGDGEMELRLTPAGVVRLGPPVDLVGKIVAADTVLAAGPAHCIGILDVQVPDTPVLTPRPECG